jgi:hypothetical protein
MGTSLTQINDIFLSSIADYKLDAIYNASGSLVLNQFCEPWTLKAIMDFSPYCTQDLTYTPVSGSADGYFAQDLTMENQILISMHMELYWLEKGLQDIRSLNNFVQDHDFSSFSPAQNIRERTANLNVKKEHLSQRIIEYSYRNNVNWNSWNSQIFNG